MFFSVCKSLDRSFWAFLERFRKIELFGPKKHTRHVFPMFFRGNLGAGRNVSIDCRDIMMFDISRGADDRP
jgi:hypothetical protein